MNLRKLFFAVAALAVASGAVAQNNKTFVIRYAESYMKQNPRIQEIGGEVKKSWKYDHGMLARAYYDLSEKTGNKAYFDYFRSFMDFYTTPDGAVKGYSPTEYNLDRVQSARGLIILHQKTGDERYRKAVQPFITQLEGQPRNADGGWWHKKVYPHQMWLDGLYMGSPFAAQYAATYGDTKWFDEVCMQLRLCYKHTRDPKTGLCLHAWDESRSQRWCDPVIGQSRYVWGRALGWYHMALVDVLDYLPTDHPQRVEIIAILKDLTPAIERARDPKTGLWWQVMEFPGRAGNYIEGSASAMFTYAMAKAAMKGYIDKRYLDVARECYKAMQNHFFDLKATDLVMKDICGGAGLGGEPYRDGSYEYYVNEDITPNDVKGAGPMLMAGMLLEL